MKHSTKNIMLMLIALIFASGCLSINVDYSSDNEKHHQLKQKESLVSISKCFARDPEIIASELQDIPIETPIYTAEQIDELLENSVYPTNSDNVVISHKKIGTTIKEGTCGAVVVGAESSVNADCAIAIGKWVGSNGYADFTAGFGVTNNSHHSIAIGNGTGNSIGGGFNNVSLNGKIKEGFGNTAINTSTWDVNRGFIGTNTSYSLAVCLGATIGNNCSDSIAIGRDVIVDDNVKHAIAVGNTSHATKDGQIILNGKDFTDVLERIATLESKVVSLEEQITRITSP